MNRFEPLLAALATDGWALTTDFLAPSTLAALAAEARERWAAGRFCPAGVGRGERRAMRADIRGDHILWLDEHHPTAAQRTYWTVLQELRQICNRELFLGLHHAELHYAVYPAGAGYRRHRDRFADHDSRMLSCCLYLNPGWSPEQGGALRLYGVGGHHDILPRLGTFVLFRSDTVEHEVLPATAARFSLTGWFHRRPPGPALG